MKLLFCRLVLYGLLRLVVTDVAATIILVCIKTHRLPLALKREQALLLQHVLNVSVDVMFSSVITEINL